MIINRYWVKSFFPRWTGIWFTTGRGEGDFKWYIGLGFWQIAKLQERENETTN